jgi:prepilin-type N-terminal cleavage/methylation domain-containing protein
MKPTHKEKGFTLIELLVVISILALLSSILFITFRSVRLRAYDTRRVEDLVAIQKALELYYHDNGRYPELTTNPFFPTYSEGKVEDLVDLGGWAELASLLSPYLTTLPRPGYANTFRRYYYFSGGSTPICLYGEASLPANYQGYALIGTFETDFYTANDGGVTINDYERYGGTHSLTGC